MELLETQLKLNKQKSTYELIILNTILSFVIIILIYFKFYRFALLVFCYQIVQNNTFLKELYKAYSIQNARFNSYYRTKFPFFFYGLPIIGFGSFIGVLYTLSLLNTTFQEMVYQINVPWYKAHQLNDLEIQLYVFVSIFMSSIIINLGISLYVIKYANHPLEQVWKPVIGLVKLAGAATGLGALGLAVAEAPVGPTKFSQLVHTKSGLGRGWDCEVGDIYGKISVLKCQHLVGHDKFMEVAKKNSKDKIITNDTLQLIMKNPEISAILDKKASMLDRQILGLPFFTAPKVTSKEITLPEAPVKINKIESINTKDYDSNKDDNNDSNPYFFVNDDSYKEAYEDIPKKVLVN